MAHSKAVLAMATRDAFIREGRRSVAPSAGAEVLTAVQEGCETATEIAARTGMSEALVRKHLRTLAAPPVEILDYFPRRRPIAVIKVEDVGVRLSLVERTSGASGALARKQHRIAQERAAYRLHLASEGRVSPTPSDNTSTSGAVPHVEDPNMANTQPDRSRFSIALLLNRRT